MSFSSRRPSYEDLIWCAGTLEDGFESIPSLTGDLPRLWNGLVRDEALAMTVVVDDQTGARVAFGAGGVISDEASEIIRKAQQPNAAVRIMQQERAGAEPILRPDAVREVNHPGHRVNLCVLHYSELIPGRSFEEQRDIRRRALAELLATLRGYATKEFIYEWYGQGDLPFIRQMGASIRTDYRTFYESTGTPIPAEHKRPFLAGLRLDEIADAWGTPIGLLFAYAEPRLFFTEMQRRILVRACRTPTPGDAEIADMLTIERATLRDHWRRIFARVAAVQAKGLLPPHLPDFGEPSRDLRGSLLEYLEQHPEELRPVDKSKFAPPPAC